MKIKIKWWMLFYTLFFGFCSFSFVQDDVNLKYHVLFIFWSAIIYSIATAGNVMYAFGYSSPIVAKIWRIFFIVFILDFLAVIPIDIIHSDVHKGSFILIVITVIVGFIIFLPAFRANYILGYGIEKILPNWAKKTNKSTLKRVSDPINQFNGGLKFLYIILWINMVLVAGSILVFFSYFFIKINNAPQFYEIIFLLVCCGVKGLLLFLMIRFMKEQKSNIPDKLFYLLTGYFISSLVIHGMYCYVLSLGWSKSLFKEDFLRSVAILSIWYLFWSFYLKKSERVLLYYGKNAG